MYLSKKRWGFLLFVILLLGTAATLLLYPYAVATFGPGSGGEIDPAVPVAVPEWLYRDIRNRLAPEIQEKLKREQIALTHIQLEGPSAEDHLQAELVVSANIDQKHGIFLLYEYANGRYEAVYEANHPIAGWQIMGEKQRMIAVSTATSNGNRDEDSLYVIRHTPEGYKVVWSGIGHAKTVGETVDMIDGNLQLDDEGNLIYLQFRRTLDATGVPIMEQSSARLFEYNEKKLHYEPK